MAINYFGNTDLEKLILLIHGEFQKYVLKVNGKDLSTNDFTNDYKNILDNIEKTYAKLASPTFTGTPLAPTATSGTNTTQIATTAFVMDAVSKVVGVSFDGGYTSYADLVARGSKKSGVIYLVANSGTTPNVNDEYYWDATKNAYELFGSTAIDLSGYVKFTDLVEITATDVETKWNAIFV